MRFTLRCGAGLLCLGALLVFFAGCSPYIEQPTASPTGDQAPVDLRDLQIETVDGHRAVLLRLSRLPTLVRSDSSSRPGRISIQAWGPAGDRDLPERSLPQSDPDIEMVRVSRARGGLNIVLDFRSTEPPDYTVHQMADWVMIRLVSHGS